MLIDWLTLRFPITAELGIVLHERIIKSMGSIVSINPQGCIEWEKKYIDWDEIRSDSSGLFWSVTGDSEGIRYLSIGASPSSLDNKGVNVFGSLDIEQCCNVLISFASRSLSAILPTWEKWDCRRMDITANYDMGSSSQVKQALRLLLGTDAPRRRTNSDSRGGDTVYWNPTSDLTSGKAYHKGAHLRMQQRKGRIDVHDWVLALADNLLRLEVKLGSRWFRRIKFDWREMNHQQLINIHQSFFSVLIGDSTVDVLDMGTLLSELENHAPSKGQALAAHRTWALIKVIGFTQTKLSVPDSSFRRHCSLLRLAGLSSADLCAGTVIPFRRQSLILQQPVYGWEDIRRTA